MGFQPLSHSYVAEAIGVCPSGHPDTRGAVDHGERHVDQLLLDPGLSQQPLGLDWTIQGDVAGKTWCPSAPPLWLIHFGDSRELGTETEELVLVPHKGPCPPRGWQ